MNEPNPKPDGTPGTHDPDDDQQQPRRLTAWQIAFSTLAAAFGVQSSRNRQRDFSHGKASHFIAAGIIFTLLFVLAMVLLVNLVLRSVS
ncbi:MAG: DUF2970 domain-containing protein [Pseudomonadales bacterium]